MATDDIIRPQGRGRGQTAQHARRYLVAALAVAGTSTAVFGTAAQATPARNASRPASAAVSHAYRHGAVPMRSSLRAHPPAAGRISSKDLHYKGGTGGVGVTNGKPAVYLVFWGRQWGTQGKDGNGYATFSGDSQQMAPDLQAFFTGLGTGGERWSGVMTQYCQGVSVGATKCPTTAQHIGYPTGGALAGVWEDTSSTSPSRSSAHQLALEAVKAASHFGNKTATSNRLTQYVIVSPTGTNPDGYKQGGFCAWHDYTGDSSMDGGGSVGGPGTPLAFTNLPYITDAGGNCGAGVVNPGNNLDGVTIVEGHEYAETITDQFPAGGWLANSGEENGDLCAWVTTGSGRMQDLKLSTGSFAVQGTWSNLANKGNGGCSVAHSTVT